MGESRRTFGPVVLAGVVSAAATALSANRSLVGVAGGAPDQTSVLAPPAAAPGLPLAVALSLVVLAAWGVLLVTRGRVRAGVAWLGLVASLGVVATLATGFFQLTDSLAEVYADAGLAAPEASVTVWFWVALGAALLSCVAGGSATRWVHSWPEMGNRYDAPGAGDSPAEPDEQTNLDLWKAMDEGRDPTS